MLVSPAGDAITSALQQPRIQVLFGSFALVGLFLAALGLFAVASFDVALRRYAAAGVGKARLVACYSHAVANPDPTRRAARYDDLAAVPDHLIAEILDGELYTWPRPAPRHADASSGLGGALRGPFDRGRGGPGGWRILFEPELHLGADVIVPDLAAWRRERLPTLPDAAYVSIAPDWACEVVSPSTASTDRVKKLRIYAREAVRHVWLVDPIARTLEVLRLEPPGWRIVLTCADFARVHAEPFEALELDLSLLWEEDPPASSAP